MPSAKAPVDRAFLADRPLPRETWNDVVARVKTETETWEPGLRHLRLETLHRYVDPRILPDDHPYKPVGIARMIATRNGLEDEKFTAKVDQYFAERTAEYGALDLQRAQLQQELDRQLDALAWESLKENYDSSRTRRHPKTAPASSASVSVDVVRRVQIRKLLEEPGSNLPWEALTETEAVFQQFFLGLLKRGELRYLSPVLSGLKKKECALLFGSLGAVELNKGCSIGCPFCGFNAGKLKGDFFPFSDVHLFSLEYGPQLHANQTFFYYGTDPFDWRGTIPLLDEALTYSILHRLVRSHARYRPFVSTAVPKGAEDDVAQNLEIVRRLSISEMNRQRLRDWLRPLTEKLYDYNIDVADIEVNPLLSARTAANANALALWNKRRDNGGINCIDGTILKPAGFHSVIGLTRTDRYIEGQVVVALDIAALEEPLPQKATAIEALLRQAVPEHRFHSGRPRFWEDEPMNVARVRNLKESNTYLFDGETGIAHHLQYDQERALKEFVVCLTHGRPPDYAMSLLVKIPEEILMRPWRTLQTQELANAVLQQKCKRQSGTSSRE